MVVDISVKIKIMREYKIYVAKVGSYQLTGTLEVRSNIYVITDENDKNHYFPIRTIIEEV